MRNRRGKAHFFLILASSFWLGIYPIYLQYDNLSEIDFFSPTPSFEILDPDDILAHEENRGKMFALRFSFAFSSLASCLRSPLLLPSLPPSAADQFTPILRC